MRIAHLILVHKNPAQVLRLVNSLVHKDCDIFIHVDRKSDFESFSNLKFPCVVHFIKKRVSIFWAGFGTIEAITNGFREIDRSVYRYINVISGQDFLIKKSDEFVDFIQNRNGVEFITCESIKDEWKEAAPRVLKYHLINYRIPGKYRIEKILNRLLPVRRFPFDYEFVGRANWFTLTNDAVNYYLTFIEKHRNVVRYFKLCWGADEFIFSTILFNSSFKDKIIPNLVYVDWKGCTNGHPRILDSGDFDSIITSGKFFARKFDETIDNEVLTRIEHVIRS